MKRKKISLFDNHLSLDVKKKPFFWAVVAGFDSPKTLPPKSLSGGGQWGQKAQTRHKFLNTKCTLCVSIYIKNVCVRVRERERQSVGAAKYAQSHNKDFFVPSLATLKATLHAHFWSDTVEMHFSWNEGADLGIGRSSTGGDPDSSQRKSWAGENCSTVKSAFCMTKSDRPLRLQCCEGLEGLLQVVLSKPPAGGRNHFARVWAQTCVAFPVHCTQLVGSAFSAETIGRP